MPILKILEIEIEIQDPWCTLLVPVDCVRDQAVQGLGALGVEAEMDEVGGVGGWACHGVFAGSHCF